MASETKYLNEAEREAARSAIDGKGVALKLDHPVSRAATIRGIRSHIDYAKSPEITALCSSENATRNADFTRARNARLIMSNIIPTPEELGLDVDDGQDDPERTRVPYCIWHPDFAAEDTYRALAARYPGMRYQVGRACAAAGMDSLYAELDLVPEVSVAEEARESLAPGAKTIYHKIMSAPYRYAILDDYHRSINISNPPCPAYLNGDTNVRHMLSCYPHSELQLDSKSGCNVNFDPLPCITETEYIRRDNVSEEDTLVQLRDDEVELLYAPLPQDLPTVNKTLLIHMAAYHGDMDRYSRLIRRPLYMSETEFLCVVRGIYHHPMFARFWATQLDKATELANRAGETKRIEIQRAISARRIMCNDRQEFENGWNPDKPQPFLIWWPQKPHALTLLDMFDREPSMRETALVASIMCGYEENFRPMRQPPTNTIYLAARRSGNPKCLEMVTKWAQDAGIDVEAFDFFKGEPYFSDKEIYMQELEPPEDGEVHTHREDRVSFYWGQDLHDRNKLDLRLLHKYIWHVPMQPGERRL
ncbi:hypothetical protein IF1G_08785 [Cordyceps javanica]|uniref:Uncharacterized protein n=1 Tax=Cordyceps javanica TaxID=43265 RepID=A0A545US18_9HYPO|nr:hypothetical protein IF1G_08785 [Cordyceps javanica]TQW04490.1 hypothetical protein IF2G_08260 [Cordyceps javanica]